jgi:phage-related protein
MADQATRKLNFVISVTRTEGKVISQVIKELRHLNSAIYATSAALQSLNRSAILAGKFSETIEKLTSKLAAGGPAAATAVGEARKEITRLTAASGDVAKAESKVTAAAKDVVSEMRKSAIATKAAVQESAKLATVSNVTADTIAKQAEASQKVTEAGKETAKVLTTVQQSTKAAEQATIQMAAASGQAEDIATKNARKMAEYNAKQNEIVKTATAAVDAQEATDKAAAAAAKAYEKQLENKARAHYNAAQKIIGQLDTTKQLMAVEGRHTKIIGDASVLEKKYANEMLGRINATSLMTSKGEIYLKNVQSTGADLAKLGIDVENSTKQLHANAKAVTEGGEALRKRAINDLAFYKTQEQQTQAARKAQEKMAALQQQQLVAEAKSSFRKLKNISDNVSYTNELMKTVDQYTRVVNGANALETKHAQSILKQTDAVSKAKNDFQIYSDRIKATGVDLGKLGMNLSQITNDFQNNTKAIEQSAPAMRAFAQSSILINKNAEQEARANERAIASERRKMAAGMQSAIAKAQNYEGELKLKSELMNKEVQGGILEQAAAKRIQKLIDLKNVNNEKAQRYINAINAEEQATGRANAAGQKLAAQYKTVSERLSAVSPQYQELADKSMAYYNAQKKATGAGYAQLSFLEQLSSGMNRVVATQLKYFGATLLVFGALAKMRQAFRSMAEVSDEAARSVTVARSAIIEMADRYSVMSKTIIDITRKFGVTVGTAGESLYQLGSAGLKVEESTAAIGSVMNLVVGTGAEVNRTTKILAGTYILLGDSMQNATGVTEKFARLADVMAAAYRDNIIELKELNDGLKFAMPVAKQVGLTFEETTGILSFLNNNMIKAGEAGRALRVIFSRMTGELGKFTEAFGIAIDPNKPLDFLDIIKQVGIRMREGALTADQVGMIFQRMGLRGANAFILMAKEFDTMEGIINTLGERAAGSAERMAQERIRSELGQLRVFAETGMDYLRTALIPIFAPIMGLVKLFNSLTAAIKDTPFEIAAKGVMALTTAYLALQAVLALVTIAQMKFAGSILLSNASFLMGAKSVSDLGAGISMLVFGAGTATKSVGVLAKVSSGFGSVLKSLGSVLLRLAGFIVAALINPWTWVIAAIGAAIYIIYRLIYANERLLKQQREIINKQKDEELERLNQIDTVKKAIKTVEDMSLAQAQGRATQVQVNAAIQEAVNMYGSLAAAAYQSGGNIDVFVEKAKEQLAYLEKLNESSKEIRGAAFEIQLNVHEEELKKALDKMNSLREQLYNPPTHYIPATFWERLVSGPIKPVRTEEDRAKAVEGVKKQIEDLRKEQAKYTTEVSKDINASADQALKYKENINRIYELEKALLLLEIKSKAVGNALFFMSTTAQQFSDIPLRETIKELGDLLVYGLEGLGKYILFKYDFLVSEENLQSAKKNVDLAVGRIKQRYEESLIDFQITATPQLYIVDESAIQNNANEASKIFSTSFRNSFKDFGVKENAKFFTVTEQQFKALGYGLAKNNADTLKIVEAQLVRQLIDIAKSAEDLAEMEGYINRLFENRVELISLYNDALDRTLISTEKMNAMMGAYNSLIQHSSRTSVNKEKVLLQQVETTWYQNSLIDDQIEKEKRVFKALEDTKTSSIEQEASSERIKNLGESRVKGAEKENAQLKALLDEQYAMQAALTDANNEYRKELSYGQDRAEQLKAEIIYISQKYSDELKYADILEKNGYQKAAQAYRDAAAAKQSAALASNTREYAEAIFAGYKNAKDLNDELRLTLKSNGSILQSQIKLENSVTDYMKTQIEINRIEKLISKDEKSRINFQKSLNTEQAKANKAIAESLQNLVEMNNAYRELLSTSYEQLASIDEMNLRYAESLEYKDYDLASSIRNNIELSKTAVIQERISAIEESQVGNIELSADKQIELNNLYREQADNLLQQLIYREELVSKLKEEQRAVSEKISDIYGEQISLAADLGDQLSEAISPMFEADFERMPFTSMLYASRALGRNLLDIANMQPQQTIQLLIKGWKEGTASLQGLTPQAYEFAKAIAEMGAQERELRLLQESIREQNFALALSQISTAIKVKDFDMANKALSTLSENAKVLDPRTGKINYGATADNLKLIGEQAKIISDRYIAATRNIETEINSMKGQVTALLDAVRKGIVDIIDTLKQTNFMDDFTKKLQNIIDQLRMLDGIKINMTIDDAKNLLAILGVTIPGRQMGGFVGGTGRGDIVPAMLEPGEFVIPRKIVKTLGVNYFRSMIKEKHQTGGLIGYETGGEVASNQKFNRLSDEIMKLVDEIKGLSFEQQKYVVPAMYRLAESWTGKPVTVTYTTEDKENVLNLIKTNASVRDTYEKFLDIGKSLQTEQERTNLILAEVNRTVPSLEESMNAIEMEPLEIKAGPGFVPMQEQVIPIIFDYDNSLAKLKKDLNALSPLAIDLRITGAKLAGIIQTPNETKAMQIGGPVPGAGRGDIVPAMLEPGEFVIPRRAVEQYGVGFFEQFRSPEQVAELGTANKARVRGEQSYFDFANKAEDIAAAQNGGMIRGYQDGGYVIPQGDSWIVREINQEQAEELKKKANDVFEYIQMPRNTYGKFSPNDAKFIRDQMMNRRIYQLLKESVPEEYSLQDQDLKLFNILNKDEGFMRLMTEFDTDIKANRVKFNNKYTERLPKALDLFNLDPITSKHKADYINMTDAIFDSFYGNYKENQEEEAKSVRGLFSTQQREKFAIGNLTDRENILKEIRIFKQSTMQEGGYVTDDLRVREISQKQADLMKSEVDKLYYVIENIEPYNQMFNNLTSSDKPVQYFRDFVKNKIFMRRILESRMDSIPKENQLRFSDVQDYADITGKNEFISLEDTFRNKLEGFKYEQAWLYKIRKYQTDEMLNEKYFNPNRMVEFLNMNDNEFDSIYQPFKEMQFEYSKRFTKINELITMKYINPERRNEFLAMNDEEFNKIYDVIYEQMQVGGKVPGSGRGDIVPAMLEPGEFVIPRKAVDKLGVDFFRQLAGKQKFATGGVVGYQGGDLVQSYQAPDFGARGIGLVTKEELQLTSDLLDKYQRLNDELKKAEEFQGQFFKTTVEMNKAVNELPSNFDKIKESLSKTTKLTPDFVNNLQMIAAATNKNIDVSKINELVEFAKTAKDLGIPPEVISSMEDYGRTTNSTAEMIIQLGMTSQNVFGQAANVIEQFAKGGLTTGKAISGIRNVIGAFSGEVKNANQEVVQLTKAMSEAFGSRIKKMIGTLKNAFQRLFSEMLPNIMGGFLDSFLMTQLDIVKGANEAAKDTADSYYDSRADLVEQLKRNEISYFDYFNRLEDLNKDANNTIADQAAQAEQDRIAAVGDAMENLTSQIIEETKRWIDAFDEFFSDVVDGFVEIGVGIAGTLGDAFGMVGQLIETAVTSLGAVGGAAGGGGIAAALGGLLGTTVAPGVGTAIGAGAGVAIGAVVGGAVGAVLETAIPIVGDIIKAFEQMASAAVKGILDLIPYIVKLGTMTEEEFANMFGGFYTDAQGIRQEIEYAESVMGLLPDDIIKFTQMFAERLPLIVTELEKNLPNIINALLGGMVTLADETVQEFEGAIPTVFRVISENLDKFVSMAIPNVLRFIETIVGLMPNLFTTIFTTLVKSAKEMLEGTAITDAFKNIVTSITTILSSAANDLIKPIVAALKENLPIIIPVITQAIVDAIPLITDAMITLMDAMIIILSDPAVQKALSDALFKLLGAAFDAVFKLIPGLDVFLGVIAAVGIVLMGLISVLTLLMTVALLPIIAIFAPFIAILVAANIAVAGLIAVIGALFSPVLALIGGIVMVIGAIGYAVAIKPIIDLFLLFGAVIESVGKKISENAFIQTAIIRIQTALDKLGQAFAKFMKAIAPAAPSMGIVDVIANGIVGLIQVLLFLVEPILLAIELFTKLTEAAAFVAESFDWLNLIFEAIDNALTGESLVPSFQMLLDVFTILDNFIQTTFLTTMNLIQTSFTGITTGWKTFGDYLTTTFKPIFDEIMKAWQTVSEFLKSIFKPAWDAIASAVNAVYQPIKDLTDFINGALTTAFNTFKSILQTVIDLIGGVTAPAEAAAETATNIGTDAVEGAEDLGKAIGNGIAGALGLGSPFHKGGIFKPQDNPATQQMAAMMGLRPNEGLALLQQGEGILTKAGVDAIGGLEKIQEFNKGKNPYKETNFSTMQMEATEMPAWFASMYHKGGIFKVPTDPMSKEFFAMLGLRSNEGLALLQEGEGILTKAGVDNMGEDNLAKFNQGKNPYSTGMLGDVELMQIEAAGNIPFHPQMGANAYAQNPDAAPDGAPSGGTGTGTYEDPYQPAAGNGGGGRTEGQTVVVYINNDMSNSNFQSETIAQDVENQIVSSMENQNGPMYQQIRSATGSSTNAGIRGQQR